jgi:hypothetical protein
VKPQRRPENLHKVNIQTNHFLYCRSFDGIINTEAIRSLGRLDDLVCGADMQEQREIENWALARAHSIMLNEGMQLAIAAQNLDKKRVSVNIYQLRRAITDSLLEVASRQRNNESG